ncbi:unnamed protein product [Ilex paraguariensis]|uniref:Uncharacterized protein n=1 Tax=Ilex paraguariensis TaxID=185542 RepID=A0ABC8RRG7_9AQUA
MGNPHNVELEAAKFLHKLIQESKDEPTKLATKLYVILQHMRSSGKENSMPYQVISRAMETVISQHNLDIEALMSSRLPLTSGTHIGDSASSQLAGSSQRCGAVNDPKASLAGNETGKLDTYASSRPLVGPSRAGHDLYQGSASHLNNAPSKVHGVMPNASSLYPSTESVSVGKALEHDGGISSTLANTNTIFPSGHGVALVSSITALGLYYSQEVQYQIYLALALIYAIVVLEVGFP